MVCHASSGTAFTLHVITYIVGEVGSTGHTQSEMEGETLMFCGRTTSGRTSPIEPTEMPLMVLPSTLFPDPLPLPLPFPAELPVPAELPLPMGLPCCQVR